MNSKSSPSRSNPLRLLSLTAAGVVGLALAVTANVRGAATPATPAAPAAAAPAAPAKAAAAAPATPAKAVAFAEIKPLLEKYCYACHGGTLAPAGTAANSIAKAGLALDSAENAAKGGRSKKPGIVAGKAAESEVIHRITLEATHKDIMPQKGKPAPNAAEIQKFVDWVNGGASWK
jgi:uncharacterized membrane protein